MHAYIYVHYLLLLFSLQREENQLKKLKLLEEEEQRKLAEKRQRKYDTTIWFLLIYLRYNLFMISLIHMYVDWSIGIEVGTPV